MSKSKLQSKTRAQNSSPSSVASQNQWPFDKYKLYSQAVQSADGDVEFFANTYKELRGRAGRVLREDFCGTFMLSCEWVKMHRENRAYGIDIDREPIDYGNKNYLPKLSESQQSRLSIIEKSVLDNSLPRVDISVAMNFSYFLFKERNLLKAYFTNVYEHLHRDGIFILDIFGGTQCHQAIQDRTEKGKFVYYWDQKGFDPITGYADFSIHFKVGKKKYNDVFTYDWRMWSIPEVRDILLEVGFKMFTPIGKALLAMAPGMENSHGPKLVNPACLGSPTLLELGRAQI